MLRRGAHHAQLVTQQLAPMPGPAVRDYYPCSVLSYGVQGRNPAEIVLSIM